MGVQKNWGWKKMGVQKNGGTKIGTKNGDTKKWWYKKLGVKKMEVQKKWEVQQIGKKKGVQKIGKKMGVQKLGVHKIWGEKKKGRSCNLPSPPLKNSFF